MKILITVDPEIPVPPKHYGGIERIVSALTKAYAQAGHTVFLLANPESGEEAAHEIVGWKGLSSVNDRDILTNALQLRRVYKRLSPDIIHSFSRLLYTYPLLFSAKVPFVQSYQRQISPHSTSVASFFGRKKIHFTACGAHMFQNLKHKHNKWTAIHNFTDTTYFQPDFQKTPEYLFFLGRIEEIKGTREAVEVALQTQTPLVIAGNIPKRHQGYFIEHIKPHLSNPLIKYVGLVNDEQKRGYLQGAKALLFPIKWEEPFGIVMAEAMACGCPVVGFRRGSVPEVVKNGENGFQVETTSEMCAAVKNLDTINRRKVRQDAENRFSIETISEKYLELFQSILKK